MAEENGSKAGCALIAAIISGLVVVLMGMALMFSGDPNGPPTCDGHDMSPTDTCVITSHGETHTYSYEEMNKGGSNPTVGLAVGGVALAVLGYSIWVLRSPARRATAAPARPSSPVTFGAAPPQPGVQPRAAAAGGFAAGAACQRKMQQACEYFDQGDLTRALEEAEAAVTASAAIGKSAGSQYEIPLKARLLRGTVLAALGRTAEARSDATYVLQAPPDPLLKRSFLGTPTENSLAPAARQLLQQLGS